MATATTGRYAVAGKNLALLQDVIRRDPESYKEEFTQQHAHLENLMRLIELQPNFDDNSIDVEELAGVVNFLTATCPAFPNEVCFREFFFHNFKLLGKIIHRTPNVCSRRQVPATAGSAAIMSVQSVDDNAESWRRG
jgi:hypothetical protein